MNKEDLGLKNRNKLRVMIKEFIMSKELDLNEKEELYLYENMNELIRKIKY